MAAAHEFDVLVVREIDRLSRNLAKQLAVERELKNAGVQIEYALSAYPNTRRKSAEERARIHR